jgi:magnesium-transporting ATPase (P-type)
MASVNHSIAVPDGAVAGAWEAAAAWHAMPAEAVMRRLGADAHGLSTPEAAARLARHGPNRLPPPPRPGALSRFLAQFRNLLILVLLVAAIATVLLGHAADAAVILAVVLINALIGFIQEGRAERALEAIRRMIDPRASVLRDGRRQTIAAEDIVPGDLVLIEAGDRVPADLRLVRARQLAIEEAALTGESVPVHKAVETSPPESPLGDRHGMAFSGTLVTTGQGQGIAVATGRTTELGRISALLSGVQTLRTPLLVQMDALARRLTVLILAIAAAAFAFAVFVRNYTFGDAFMAMVGLAVAAIPEGLPAVMTITLAIGVQRMAARNAIIRRLPAAETLGAVSVICSDKTGTLTLNAMMVTSIVTAEAEFSLSGSGYAPEGAVTAGGRPATAASQPSLAALLRAAVLCNDAALRAADGDWRPEGDPMEAALLAAAMKAGLDPEALRAGIPRHDAIPFDSAHRFMASLHEDDDGVPIVVLKGAPERVLAMCGAEWRADGTAPLDQAAWLERAEALAARGQRVLAFAMRENASRPRTLDHDDVESGLLLLGLAGFIDPPRPEAIEAVRDCRAAGIRVVMITGDHVATAREIARQLGIAEDPVAIEGAALERMDETALRQAARTAHVFARTTPEHKLRLVSALQAEGLFVAMTGDGVNDAPALKRADIGVAMGAGGTEVAKQAADMVLADDNFASIVAAVREGRTVYDNIVKVIGWTLPTNGGEAFIILAALAIGMALPITPLQILWINMVTAVALGLTLAFEPTEPGAMRRPPRPPGASLLDGRLLWRVGFVSLLFLVAAFGLFTWAKAQGHSLELARTMVVNVVIVLEIAHLFNVRYVHGASLTWRGVLGTRAVLIGLAVTVAAQLMFTYAPFMQAVFDSRPVPLFEGAVIIACGIAMFAVVEIEKALFRRLSSAGSRHDDGRRATG